MNASRAWRALGLDLVSLRLFVAIAEEGTFAKAASRENIALSAVSRRISDLENRTGVQLFERQDRGVLLAAAGAQLLEQVRNVFSSLERIALDLEALRDGVQGHVRIQAHMSAAAFGLPQVLATFLDAHPQVSIEVDELTSLEVLHGIRTGLADVGFVSGTVNPDGLHLIKWQSDELVAILPLGHPLSEQEELSLSDLLAHPLVCMQRDSALLALYREQARAIGRDLRVRIHAASFESVNRMVSAGLGVAIMPAGMATPPGDNAGLHVRRLAESWTLRPLMLCVRDPERLSAASRLFIQHVTGSFS